MRITFTIAFLTALLLAGHAQEAILLENPSFEGTPHHSLLPGGWFDCGHDGESPPDLHPTGEFDVTQRPLSGRSYLGMVARDNNTWEAVGQRLARPMAGGQCYRLGLFLCRSEKYVSLSRATNQVANYATPAILRIWGGTEECGKAQLLAATEPVRHPEWAYYEVTLKPKSAFEYLLLEIYYDPFQSSGPYNGNILVDKLSGLSPVDCKPAETGSSMATAPSPEPEEALAPEYPVLEVELPSEDGLAAFIVEQGKQAKFTASGDDFYQRFFIDGTSPGQKVIFGNEHLYWIAKALVAHPGYVALFSVGGENEGIARARLGSIQAVFRAAGLAESQYGLKLQNRADRKREWLWGMDEHEYLIYLSKK
ncbi:MAG: hypothetical protein H6559_13465 [Lewinellaceae bacterium]|nr:hypothetical protein [Lewinellaceae bacterium]